MAESLESGEPHTHSADSRSLVRMLLLSVIGGRGLSGRIMLF